MHGVKKKSSTAVKCENHTVRPQWSWWKQWERPEVSSPAVPETASPKAFWRSGHKTQRMVCTRRRSGHVWCCKLAVAHQRVPVVLSLKRGWKSDAAVINILNPETQMTNLASCWNPKHFTSLHGDRPDVGPVSMLGAEVKIPDALDCVRSDSVMLNEQMRLLRCDYISAGRENKWKGLLLFCLHPSALKYLCWTACYKHVC